MKKRIVILTVSLIAAVIVWFVFADKLRKVEKMPDDMVSSPKTGQLTDKLLYDDWVTEEYLIFEDGSVYSRKNFEKVMKLNLSEISYTDGALCVSGDFVALQDAEDNVSVYDLTCGKKVTDLKVIRGYDGTIEMSLSKDGRYLLYKQEDSMAGIFDLATGQKLRDIEGWFFSEYQFSDDGRYCYDVEYQDAHSGSVYVYNFDDPSKDAVADFWGRLCPIDEGGNFLVDMETDMVLDLKSDRKVDLKVDGYFEFSHDGRFLAVETPAEVVRVYDTGSWEIVFEQSFIKHSGTIFIDQDRYMLICHYLDTNFSGTQKINVYDTTTWTLQNTLELDAWVEDLMNLEGTFVYDYISGAIVDVLSSEALQFPYTYDAVDILWQQGDLIVVLLTTYADYDTVDRLIVLNRKTGEYLRDSYPHKSSSVFVSQTGDILLYNDSSGAAFI